MNIFQCLGVLHEHKPRNQRGKMSSSLGTRRSLHCSCFMPHPALPLWRDHLCLVKNGAALKSFWGCSLFPAIFTWCSWAPLWLGKDCPSNCPTMALLTWSFPLNSPKFDKKNLTPSSIISPFLQSTRLEKYPQCHLSFTQSIVSWNWLKGHKGRTGWAVRPSAWPLFSSYYVEDVQRIWKQLSAYPQWNFCFIVVWNQEKGF